MDVREFIDYEVNVVSSPEGGKQMEIVLKTKRHEQRFIGGLALQLTDLMSSILGEYERKAIALDIEEGNYG